MNNNKNIKPPSLFSWLLIKSTPREKDFSISGDYEEIFQRMHEKDGAVKANYWYIVQVLKALGPNAINRSFWSLVMLRNYLKTATRNIQKHKVFSFINLMGLSIGIAAFFLISFWVNYELSYDKFYNNADNIYRVVEKRSFADNINYSMWTSGLLAKALRENYPEIKYVGRQAWASQRVIKSREMKEYEGMILCVDPEYLSIFSFNFIKGDKNSALSDPYGIILTKSTAEKYFGNDNPIGKTLGMDSKYNFTVSGVVEDNPDNTHLSFDMLVNLEIVKKLGWDTETWDFSMVSTYIQLEKDADDADFENKIAGLVRDYSPDSNIELFLQPLTEIYLYSDFSNSEMGGRIRLIYILFTIGVLILLMACVNYMNLSTARSESRSKEIGLRKVVGANRSNLVKQFLIESVFIAALSMFLLPVVLYLFLPQFNVMTGMSLEILDFTTMKVFGTILGISVLTGLLAGSYPALLLSSFNPVQVLKGNLTVNNSMNFRKILTILQISISMVLIVCSSVIYYQVDFLKNRDMGFDKENVITIPLGMSNLSNAQIYKAMKEKLKNEIGVESITASFTNPLNLGTPPTSDITFRGESLSKSQPISLTSVEYDFTELFNIRIVEGRSFSLDFGAEKGKILVNETFAKLLNEKDVIGQSINIGADYSGEIIGVMKDFDFGSGSQTGITPLLIFYNPNVNYIFVKASNEISDVIKKLEIVWDEVNPEIPFQSSYLYEDFEANLSSEDNLAEFIKYFTFIAAFIAFLGLYGLASFTAEKRTKEIGIRKILGSTNINLVKLLCVDYLKILLVSTLVAIPSSWAIMNLWLESFPFKADLSFWIFADSVVITLLLIITSVSYQAIKAARTNPSLTLKYE